MLLKQNGDINVRTLLAWPVLVPSAGFMHGDYADRTAHDNNSVHHSNYFSEKEIENDK